MFGPMPTNGWSLIMCAPSRSMAMRSRLVGILQREDRRVAIGDRRRRQQEEERRDDRQQGEQAAVLEQQQQRGRGAGADPGVAREAERHGDGERRNDERRPQAIAFAEQHAGERRADDEHQQARVRHVVAERALRPPSEVVVVQDAELHDADDGAHGGERDDHRDHRRRVRAGREAVDQRHEQEQHHLLVGHQARARVGRERGRDERDGGVQRERPGKRRHFDRFAVDDDERTQQTNAIVSRIWAIAIENCRAPATPYTAARPACSRNTCRWANVALVSAATVMADTS